METAIPKKERSRRALKNVSSNDVNISAGKSSTTITERQKEDTPQGLSLLLSPSIGKKGRSKAKASAAVTKATKSFADELLELQGRLEQLQIEKAKAEETVKQQGEMIKQKDEEIENRDKEQDKLQKELKKLQKMKEFKPTMNIPLVASLREKEQEKKKKDQAAAKKPCPAYILWCKDQWNEVKKANTDADFKEVSNALGAKWKQLSAEEKKPYDEKYQQEKEAYLQVIGKEKREKEAMKLLEEEQMQKTAMELLEQYMQFKQEAEKEVKKTRKEKDPEKPKHPMSAFFLFSKERRQVLLEANKNVVEVSKILGEEWKNMSETQKAPYEEKAKEEKEDYNHKMEIYKQKKVEEAATLEKEENEQKKVLKQEALQLLKKKERTDNIIKKTKENKKTKKKRDEQNVDPNKPKRPASSFILFSKEARKKLQAEKPEISNSTLNAMISIKWKEISETEKQNWNEAAGKAMTAYKKDMEEYNKTIAVGSSTN